MQDLKRRRLEAETFLEFARLANIEHQRLQALFLEANLDGVTPQQSRALMIMFQAGEPMTAKRLSQEMGCSEVTVSRFVKALLNGEWISRTPDPNDGRALQLMPTARAREALPRFIGVSNQLLDRIFAGFDVQEVQQLASSMQRIRLNLEA